MAGDWAGVYAHGLTKPKCSMSFYSDYPENDSEEVLLEQNDGKFQLLII